MSTKIEDTIINLVKEGRKAGYLTPSGMNKLMEDQFVPPDQLRQVLLALEEAGIDVIEDEELASSDGGTAISIKAGDGLMKKKTRSRQRRRPANRCPRKKSQRIRLTCRRNWPS